MMVLGGGEKALEGPWFKAAWAALRVEAEGYGGGGSLMEGGSPRLERLGGCEAASGK